MPRAQLLYVTFQGMFCCSLNIPRIVTSLLGFGQLLRDEVPVDDLPKLGQVIGATVLVVLVVRVLPHVDSQERSQIFSNWCSSVACVDDSQILRRWVINQPCPPRTEIVDSSVDECLLEGLDATKVGSQGGRHLRRNLAASGSDALPKKRVIEMLGCLVEQNFVLNNRSCALGNLLNRSSIEPSASQRVQFVNIRFVFVFVVMLIVSCCELVFA
jgi:hypothetical protein